MPSESPTRSRGTPASSSSFAIGKSYAVSAAIFSPRTFMARISATVIFGEFIFKEAPSTKHQHPEKHQISNIQSDKRTSFYSWSLKLEVSLELGCWCLVLSR